MLSLIRVPKRFLLCFVLSLTFIVPSFSNAQGFSEAGFHAERVVNWIPRPDPIPGFAINLEGTVLDEFGAPAANVPVFFVLDDSLGFETMVLTDINGHYSINGYASKHPVDGVVHSGCSQDLVVNFKSNKNVGQNLFFYDCFDNIEPGFANAN